tara:strand:- start:1833 stop:2534 length:702 start_codon:yes stop_codon:yes gene_type:complete
MSNVRLFYQESLYKNLISVLDKPQSHYLIKVMRIKIGQNFSLFNQGGEWEAKINQVNKGMVEFQVNKKLRSITSEREIYLAFTPIKSNYLNVMIQKATELGVTKFIPIISDRTIVRKINEKRLKKIIIEASEQSNRIKVPTLEKIFKLKDFLKINYKTNIIFGDLNTDNIKFDIKNLDPICVLVGPEGDFTTKERDDILKLKNVKPVKINRNILRSETAAISIISILSYNILS